MKKIITLAALLMIGICFSGAAISQAADNYPAKPVTLIVPFNAGGGTDIGMRIATKYATEYLGQPIVVENIDGGGSEIGVSQMIRSKPDGYTISGFNSASITLTLLRKASYDALKDIAPICLLVSDPRLFAVRANDERFKTAADFIQYAKDHPGDLTIGTSGAGTSGHLSIMVMNRAAGIKTKPVHFKGAGASRAAFLGGHIDAIAQTLGEIMEMQQTGQARAIAVATEERIKELPDVPTFKEVGINLVISSNRGLAAPKDTPPEIINKIADVFKKVSENPDYLAEMAKIGLPVQFLGPQEYGASIVDEYEIYAVIADELKQK